MNEQGKAGSDSRTGGEPWDTAQAERLRDNDGGSYGTVPHLLRQLTAEVTGLFSKEVSLARAEVRETVHEIKAGLMSIMSGGIVLLAGLIMLLTAAMYGLATFMALWLAALIVGGVVSLIGMTMLSAGKHKLDADALKPHRTANAINQDRKVMKAAVKGGH